MKYLSFNNDGKCTGVFDTEEPNTVAYDLDDTKEWFSCLLLVNGEVTNPFAHLAREAQPDAYNQAVEQASFEYIRSMRVPMVKEATSVLLAETAWRLERAREQDELDGTTDKTQAVLQMRQDIRDAGNAHEATLLAITDKEELEAFDPREIPGFPRP